MNMNSIEYLENDYWGKPPPQTSRLIKSCFEIRKKDINLLSNNELRICISQNIGLQYLIPKALEKIKSNPLLEANYYQGDLLISVLSVDFKQWRLMPIELEELIGVVTKASFFSSVDLLDLETATEIRKLVENLR